MEERKRGLDNDDDSGVNTVRSSGQSATKAPEEKSHLSLLRLFSRPLVPLFQRGLSLHHTRGCRHTVVCVRARVHLRHARRYPSIPRPLPIPLTRAGHPLLSLSFMSIENTAFSIGTSARVHRAANYSGTTCRCTHGRARSRVWVHRIRGSATVVSVYVSVGEKWEMGHATRALVGRERVSGSGAHMVSPRSSGLPPSWGTLSSLHVGRLARSLFFYSILSGLSLSFANRVLLHLLRLRTTLVSFAFVESRLTCEKTPLWLLSPLKCTFTFETFQYASRYTSIDTQILQI